MLKKVIKNTTVVGAGTLASRALGLIRDILIARFFGTSYIFEAFIVAFRIPNLLRSLLGEGFADSVAVPALSQYHNNKERLFAAGNNLLVLSASVAFLFTCVGIVFSRQLVSCIAPGFIGDPEKFHLAVSFTRITFIYLLLIGITTNIHSLLYALKRFFVPAFAPCILNISFIAGIVLFASFFKNYILVACVIGAGILNVIVSFFFLYKEGFRLAPRFRAALGDTLIHKMVTLFIPRLWSAAIYHINVLVDTIFASLSAFTGLGAMAAIYFANRIIQFPLALIAVSRSRVAVVDFARFAAGGETDDFKKLLIFSFQNLMLFVIPISCVFFFVHEDIIRIIFFGGKFGAYSLSITAATLFFYTLGLPFFCGIKLFVHVFYSLSDTRTPAKTATISLFINALLNAVFIFPVFKMELGVGGIALASSIAAACNFFLLWRALGKRIRGIDWSGVVPLAGKLLVVGLCLGFVSKWLFSMKIAIAGKLCAVIGATIGLFIILCLALNIPQMQKAIAWLLRLRKK